MLFDYSIGGGSEITLDVEKSTSIEDDEHRSCCAGRAIPFNNSSGTSDVSVTRHRLSWTISAWCAYPLLLSNVDDQRS